MRHELHDIADGQLKPVQDNGTVYNLMEFLVFFSTLSIFIKFVFGQKDTNCIYHVYSCI